MTYDKAKKFLQSFEASNPDDFYAELGVSRAKARVIFKLHHAGQLTPEMYASIVEHGASVAAPKTRKIGHPLRKALDAEEFRKQFDVPSKVREGITSLENQVILDNDFRMELGISVQAWKAVTGRKEFSANRLDIKGRTYWGHAAVLKRIKKTIDIL